MNDFNRSVTLRNNSARESKSNNIIKRFSYFQTVRKRNITNYNSLTYDTQIIPEEVNKQDIIFKELDYVKPLIQSENDEFKVVDYERDIHFKKWKSPLLKRVKFDAINLFEQLDKNPHFLRYYYSKLFKKRIPKEPEQFQTYQRYLKKQQKSNKTEANQKPLIKERAQNSSFQYGKKKFREIEAVNQSLWDKKKQNFDSYFGVDTTKFKNLFQQTKTQTIKKAYRQRPFTARNSIHVIKTYTSEREKKLFISEQTFQAKGQKNIKQQKIKMKNFNHEEKLIAKLNYLFELQGNQKRNQSSNSRCATQNQHIQPNRHILFANASLIFKAKISQQIMQNKFNLKCK